MASFYSKERRAAGLVIRAHRDVSDLALEIAAARIHALLDGCPGVSANLAEAGAELHLVGSRQAVSDLPMYRHLAGRPFEGSATIDERGRGYGGLHATCAEESLLCGPTARHSDHRDICSHELAHTVLAFGVDEAIGARVEERYRSSLRKGLWRGAYAATNPHEFFAETTMWWVGSHGDVGWMEPEPERGRDWLWGYDPEMAALLEEIYLGRLVPQRLRWERPVRVTWSRTVDTGPPTTLVFSNQTAGPVSLAWLSGEGERRPYAWLHPEAIWVQPTYAGHVWQVTDSHGTLLGRYAAGERPGRVELWG